MTPRYLLVLFGLYLVCLMTSTAGMEFFSSLIGLLFFFYLGRDLRSGQTHKVLRILKLPPVYFGLLFIVASGISSWLTPVEQTPFMRMFGINRNILLLIAFLYLFPTITEKPSKKWLGTLLGIFFVVSIYAYFQSFTGIDLMREQSPFLEKIHGYYRAIGFFAIPLTFAYAYGVLLFLILPLAFSQYVSQLSLGLRVLFYLTLISMPFAILVSGSRGAWVAMFVTGVLYVLFSHSKKMIMSFMVLALLIGAAVWNVPYLNSRFQSIVDPNHTSNSARLRIWKANYEIFKDHFWIGAGPNQSDILVPDYYKKLEMEPPDMLPPNHHAHNDFIQTAAGTGIIGLLLYLSMSFSFLVLGWKAWKRLSAEDTFQKPLALGCLFAQIFFHIGGMTQCNYIDREVNHVLLVVWFLQLSMYLLVSRPHKNYESSI